MSRRIIKSSIGRGVLAVLMLAALAMRIVVPTGFMPVAAGGGIVVTICSSSGPLSQVIELGGEHHDGQQGKEQRACTFASTLGGGLAPTLALAAAPLLFATIPALGRAIADLTVHRLAAPPPPSQGPPAQS